MSDTVKLHIAIDIQQEDDNADTVHAGEATLRCDEQLAGTPTTFRFEVADADSWHVLAECARYTLRVVLYRPQRLGELVLS